jgi:hypothetical protein
LFLATFTILFLPFSTAFQVASTTMRPKTGLWYESKGDSFDSDRQLLEERLTEMRAQVYEEEYRRPPNPNLSPIEFVDELLKALYDNGVPLPDSGFRLLLRASTKQWRRKVYQSVAAPEVANEEAVASTLGEAMARPHNQFAILVGEAEDYVATFPTEPIDYSDGTCWLECRLRDPEDDTLFAVTGWSLVQRKTDGAWLVDGIDWQDFRGES